MPKKFEFTFRKIESEYRQIMKSGYKIIACSEYLQFKKKQKGKLLINRVDIDEDCAKAGKLAKILNRLKIRATFFVRLHAKEYNPFSLENYPFLKFIRDSGHEIGYHSEVVDEENLWKENGTECMKRDIEMINKMLGIKIKGVASHGGFTRFNNLDFWKNHQPSEFGLLYEAYDKQPNFDLFDHSLYVSDSEWVKWKCYRNGLFLKGDNRSPAEHALCGEDKVIYSLIHPETYHDKK